jgi:Protein of unknown function (DUF998)
LVAVPLRLAALCGLVAPLTYVAGLVFGGLAQPDEFSSANDDISDLGAETASSAWIYNQVGVNLTGILIVIFALGLWLALSPSVLGRLGAAAVALTGLTLFLEGFFRLDCRGIDTGCENTSWISDGHKLLTGISGAFLFAAPLLLAFAFRRLPGWRRAWLPSLLAIPVFIAASVLFSLIGNGASTRAGAVAWFIWLGYVAYELLQKAEVSRVRTEF